MWRKCLYCQPLICNQNYINKMKKILLSLTAILVLFVSCSESDLPTEKEQSTSSTYEQTIGSIDKNQTWTTLTPSLLFVNVPKEGILSVYCEDVTSRVYLYSKRIKAGSTSIMLDVPQHLEQAVEVYGLDENEEPVVTGTTYRTVIVSYNCNGNESTERVSFEQLHAGANVSFSSARKVNATRADESTKAVNEAPKKAALTGKVADGMELHGYSTFPGEILDDLAKAIPEGKRAKNLINDFQMTSNGAFLVSMIYGVTGNTAREMGYYYYMPNNESNITYVPFADVLKWDYYYDGINFINKEDAISKTQVKMNGQWYDVNYQHYDDPTRENTRNTNQNGDDVYNILTTKTKNPGRITELRGITFKVDAPKGSVVGFYCYGVDGGVKFRNYSEKKYNTQKLNDENLYTSVIRIYNGYRFIGLEDGSFKSGSVKDSEPDCNDVVFVMVPGGNSQLPDVRLPYVYDITKKQYYNGDGTYSVEPKKDVLTDGPQADSAEPVEGNLQSWTMGFERLGSQGDYDFNDVVIHITPNNSTHKAKVEICAVGSVGESDLYYGTQKLGEVHELIGVNVGVMANTGNGTTTVPTKLVGYVDWPEGKSMTTNASDFYILRPDGFKATVATTPGETPNAICVSGEWTWPLERVVISHAYTLFGEWGANASDKNYWNWYTQPVGGKVYTGE